MKKQFTRIVLFTTLLVSSLFAADAPVDMAKRTKELQDLRFGMFICWSFSTFSGKEWTPGVKDVSFFKATEVDTDQWAQTAKEAGMGYILFLTKHHDGFCLWDTKTTDRKVTKAPLGRDVLKELKKSCDKYGIKLALYFSEGEWQSPGGLDHPETTGAKKANQGGSDPELKKSQLKELLTQYGPIEYIWFDHAIGDGGLCHSNTIAFCKSLQPGCFVGFNHGDQTGVDIRLGEMGKPGPLTDHKAAGPHMRNAPSKTYLLAEFTYPIQPKHNGGAMWFYSLPIHDGLCMSAEDIYKDYLGAKKYGNVFALDVGPDYNGKIRKIDVQTLRKVGEMIRSGAELPDVSEQVQKEEKERLARTEWFREAKFGMFITWGLYSVPAGTWKGQELKHEYGEWIEWALPIPHDEYAGIAKTWNPKQFDADAWVKTAKDAGMKYLLITAKFHDGFLMYPSKITSYNIVDRTPWKRDPVKELGDACARQGLKFGVYWNHVYDWQHPDAITPDSKGSANRNLDKYIDEVSLPQLKEMLTNYPLISFIWFDQARNTPEMTFERGKKFADLIRSIRPELIFNSRLGAYPSDYISMGDNGLPSSIPKGVWESPCTINHTWGYKAQDTDYKSASDLIFNLVDVASKGGNYMLNIGPTGDGIIPVPQKERLLAMGDWMKINSEAIYGAGRTPFGEELGSYDPVKKDNKGKAIFNVKRDWRCTVKPMDWTWGKAGKLYFHFFKWPGVTFELADVKGKIEKAYMLADPDRKALKHSVIDGKLTIELPEQATDEIASVLCIEVKQ